MHMCPIHLIWCPTLLKVSDFTEINSPIDMNKTNGSDNDVDKIDMDNDSLEVTLALDN